MTEQKPPTYEELVERNQRLANKIVNMGDQFQETLRTEIRRAKREAWIECANDSVYIAPEYMPQLLLEKNPYR